MLHLRAISHPHWLCPSRETRKEFRLSLSFSVLTFTCEAPSHNALARVSKSRTGGFHRLMGTVGTEPVVFHVEYSTS